MSLKLSGVIAAAALLAIPAQAQAQAQEPQAAQETSRDQLSDPSSRFVPDARRKSWHAEVEKTERGHLIGDPEARVSMIEFMSYTCPHCADFAQQGEGAIDMVLLAPGEMNLEVRPVIRNGVDLAVSLLVQCGDPEGFKDRHRMYLARQRQWLAQAQSAPASQQALWARGDRAARVNVAAALDLDDMLAERGTSRTAINACLNDDQAALALIRNGQADAAELGVRSTPSFALDGELLEGVHSWATLYPVLEKRFSPENAQD